MLTEAQAGSQRSQPLFDVDVPRSDTRTTWTATIRLALGAKWSREKHPIRKFSKEIVSAGVHVRVHVRARVCVLLRVRVRVRRRVHVLETQ